jgi:hypothetical protein
MTLKLLLMLSVLAVHWGCAPSEPPPTMKGPLPGIPMQAPLPAISDTAWERSFEELALTEQDLLRPANSYAEARVDETGQLVILTKDGRRVLPKKDTEQETFGDVLISEDGRAIGWLNEYFNCCTSYPVSQRLVVYAGGLFRTFQGPFPIFGWQFRADATQVAFLSEPLHFVHLEHYELRDIATGRLLAEYACGQYATPSAQIPGWVTDLKVNLGHIATRDCRDASELRGSEESRVK